MDTGRGAWLGLLLSGALLAAGCGPLQEGPGPTPRALRQGIVGGQLAPGDAAVFLLRIFDAAGEEYTCTATLIAPRTLLTAAHCIDDPTLTLYAGNALHAGGQPSSALLRVTDWRVHPGWDNQSPDFAFDLAVAKLETAPTVAPLEWSAQPATALVGKAVRVLGYGSTHPITGGEGSRRVVDLVVDDVTAEHLYVGNSANKGFCYGDSGGPTLHLFPDGVERLVGVHSFNWDDDCTYGGDTRVDLGEHVAFVNGWLAEHEAPEPEPEPQPEPEPEPTPVRAPVVPRAPAGWPEAEGGCSAAGGAQALWGAVLLAALCARRRRRATTDA